MELEADLGRRDLIIKQLGLYNANVPTVLAVARKIAIESGRRKKASKLTSQFGSN